MERLTFTKRLAILCGLFLATGAGLNIAPQIKQTERTESEVAAMLPAKVGGFNAVLAPGEYCTYKMDKVNYDVLQPWGIIPRDFVNGPERYEVVVIASRKKESFHDPQVCLTAQGWQLTNQRVDHIETKTRGTVPVTLFDMSMSGDHRTAMYLLKTPQGYQAELGSVKWEMFRFKAFHFGKDEEGAFVRIMPKGILDVEKMKKFAADWIDEATKTSNGFY